MTIKALIFDVGGVLRLSNYSERPARGHHSMEIHNTIAKKLNKSIDAYLDAIDTPYAKSIEGLLSEKQAIKTMALNLETTPKKLTKLYLKAYQKYFSINKELIKYALKKKKQGYKISILSDQWWLSKRALFPKVFYTKFKPTIISCDVGVRKPDKKIYEMTLKKLKLPAKATVFIDNRDFNLIPAKKLGMKTVLFKNNKQAISEIEKLLK